MIKLVYQYYLPLQDNAASWKNDPESFIELEDENYFISEFDLDAGCTVNLLGY